MCCARSPNRSHRLFCCHREVKYTPFSLTFHDMVAEGSTQFASVVSITIIFHEQTAAAHTHTEKKPVTNEKRRSLHWSFWFWLEHLAKEFLCCAHFHLMWAHVFWKIICFVRNSGSPSTGFAFFSPLNPCFVQSIKIFTWFFYVPPSLWFAAVFFSLLAYQQPFKLLQFDWVQQNDIHLKRFCLILMFVIAHVCLAVWQHSVNSFIEFLRLTFVGTKSHTHFE